MSPVIDLERPRLPVVHTHSLDGCRTRPLADYLKALGVLRIVAEQADADARGAWSGGRFVLRTRLDGAALHRFFLEDYAPSPLLAPWNGGSGFYPKDKTAREKGLLPIKRSEDPRFEAFRLAIHQAESVVADRSKKPEKGYEKNKIIAACRRLWRGAAGDWLDAAVVRDAAGEPAYPALLGSGGNDGRLDFTSNFMQRLVELFGLDGPVGAASLAPDAADHLEGSLLGTGTSNRISGAIGQFSPQVTGGPNGTTGFDGSVALNPWDYLLLLEGSLLLTAGLSRRAAAAGLGQATAPFAVRAVAVGYGNAADSDAGPRGEQWMPLWSAPASLPELQQLFREARAVVSGRPARDGVEMARAVAVRGVDRRLDGFERYGFIERNGLSNLAVPLGRICVPNDIGPEQRLLAEVEGWLSGLHRMAGDKLAPASIKRAAGACDAAMFACTQAEEGNRTTAFQNLLMALAEAEDQLVRSPQFAMKHNARPLSRSGGRRLSEDWLPFVREDSAEFRLALTLSQTVGGPRELHPAHNTWPVRAHWLPLDPTTKPAGRAFLSSESGLRGGPDRCCGGRNLEDDLIALLRRRRLAAIRASDKRLPMRVPHPGLGASAGDLEAFLNQRDGERVLDDARLLRLARGLMAVQAGPSANRSTGKTVPGTRLALFTVLRASLPHHPAKAGSSRINPLPAESNPAIESRVLPLLEAGRGSDALALASRRLRILGSKPTFQTAVVSAAEARRLAASMAFCLHPGTLDSLLKAFTRTPDSDRSSAPSSSAGTHDAP